MKKRRLDEMLIERKQAKGKREAFIVVTEGRVTIDGQKAVSPAQIASSDAVIEVSAADKYVGRGAEKLEAAMEKFGVLAEEKICADIGAATGGFTEVLLRRGAKKVYAIDTARGKLALKIRDDPRVVVMERADARDLKKLPDLIDLAVIDVSLISLRGILPSIGRLLTPNGAVVALFKPQYETRDPRILHHGIITEAESREKLLADFTDWLAEHKWSIIGRMQSPVTGAKGNVEYLFYLKQSGQEATM